MKLLPIITVSLALGIASAPARAEPEAKPAISVTTKAAEITVTIDARFKPYPALVADCLAEGRRWVAASRAEAAANAKDDRPFFKEGRRYSYERVYELRSVVGGRYVSVVRSDGTYTGGAHPNQRIDTILWDQDIKKRISIRSFFGETADNGPTMNALAKLVRRAVVIAKIERGNQATTAGDKTPMPADADKAADADQLLQGIMSMLTRFGPVTLAPSTVPSKSSGLTVHYSPYDVDSYAAGPYTIFIPWIDFKAFLSSAGVGIFQGNRPKADIDDN